MIVAQGALLPCGCGGRYWRRLPEAEIATSDRNHLVLRLPLGIVIGIVLCVALGVLLGIVLGIALGVVLGVAMGNAPGQCASALHCVWYRWYCRFQLNFSGPL